MPEVCLRLLFDWNVQRVGCISLPSSLDGIEAASPLVQLHPASRSFQMAVHDGVATKRGAPIPVQWSPLSSKKKKIDSLASLSTPTKKDSLPFLSTPTKDRAPPLPQPPATEDETENATTAAPCIWKQFASDLQEWMGDDASKMPLERLKEDIHEATENALLSTESVNDCVSFLNVVVSFLKRCTTQKQQTDGYNFCFLLIQLFFTLINANQEKKLCVYLKQLICRLFLEELLIAIASFLRSAIQRELEAYGEIHHESEIAMAMEQFNQLLRQSSLPQSLLFYLDDMAWYFLRNQAPSNSILYNETFQLRNVRFRALCDLLANLRFFGAHAQQHAPLPPGRRFRDDGTDEEAMCIISRHHRGMQAGPQDRCARVAGGDQGTAVVQPAAFYDGLQIDRESLLFRSRVDICTPEERVCRLRPDEQGGDLFSHSFAEPLFCR